MTTVDLDRCRATPEAAAPRQTAGAARPRTTALGGAVLVGAAVVAIWAARAMTEGTMYVSQLGADGMSTAGLAFVVASQVPCSYGCPLPLTELAGVQDLLHVTAAVIGFAAAAAAMIFTAVCRGPLQKTSIVVGVLVALTSGTGALLSLLGTRTDIGSTWEFVAMTFAAAWLCVFAVAIARRASHGGGFRA